MPEHSHSHRHHATTAQNRRRLLQVLLLTAAYLLAEVIGGILTNSLALLSDAGHMLTDVAALGLALVALWFAQRPATPRKTYGYYRLEILAALLNGIVLFGLSAFIIIESINRLQHPPAVGGLGLLIIASGGLVVNIVGAYLLQHGHAHSLNMRAAFYHVLSDALGSVGAIMAGLLIYFYHWNAADPILAILISLLIIVSAFALVREAVDILLEATPRHIDADAVRASLLGVTGVTGVHDLHIWTITSGMYALSCHVVVEPDCFAQAKLEEIRHLLHDCCGIPHQTVQIETSAMASDEDVHL
ncbi:MAG TPA: cation diffusion facilitator family transporter [Armatimonadota bacterium]|jgi:cobalt-zinc-cadmium efflux system protein